MEVENTIETIVKSNGVLRVLHQSCDCLATHKGVVVILHVPFDWLLIIAHIEKRTNSNKLYINTINPIVKSHIVNTERLILALNILDFEVLVIWRVEISLES